MHQPSGGIQGQAADIAIQAEQMAYIKQLLAERIAYHTGQTRRADRRRLRPRPLVHRRGRPRSYGIIDQVIQRRRQIDVD